MDLKIESAGGSVEDGLSCPKCDAKLSSQHTLNRHLKTIHGDGDTTDGVQRSFKCPVEGCQTEMVRRDHLYQHIRSVHKTSISADSEGSTLPGGKKMKMTTENDHVLCILCCFSFRLDRNPEKNRENCTQFTQFTNQVVPQNNSGSLLTSLEGFSLSVCPSCLNLTGKAEKCKATVDKIEGKVRRLQREVLKEMRTLQKELVQYSREMKRIEDLVSSADVACLQGSLKAKGMRKGKAQVLELREGILQIGSQLERYQEELGTKVCTPVEKVEQIYPEPIYLESDNEDNGGDLDTFVNQMSDLMEDSGEAFKKEMLKLAENESREWEVNRKVRIPERNLKYYFNYTLETDCFQVGDVEIVINETSKVLQCSQCPYRALKKRLPETVTVSQAMQRHVRREHLLEFQCPKCESILGSFEGYVKHVREHMKGGAGQKKVKPSPSKIQVPETSASTGKRGAGSEVERSFICDTCGKGFTTKRNLKKHMVCHSEERPFPCRKGCGYTFKDKKHIARHEARCTGEMTKGMLMRWQLMERKKYSKNGKNDVVEEEEAS